jgi:hypothetical protein
VTHPGAPVGDTGHTEWVSAAVTWSTVQSMVDARACALLDVRFIERARQQINEARNHRGIPVEDFLRRFLINDSPCAFGSDYGSKTWGEALEAGWSAAAYQEIRSLGHDAAKARSYVSTHLDSIPNVAISDAMTESHYLGEVAELATTRGATVAQVMPWLHVLAACQDPLVAAPLMGVLAGWSTPDLKAHPLTEWVAAVGDLAPLVCAARVSLDEARSAEPGLENRLRVLLSLRSGSL